MAMLPIRPRQDSVGVGTRTAAGLACFVLAFVAFAGRGSRAGRPRSIPACRRCPGGIGSSLGPAPGAGSSALGDPARRGGSTASANLPGGGVLGGRAGPYAPKGVPTSITTPGGGPGPTALQMPVTGPQPQPVGADLGPFAGTLELPSSEDHRAGRRPDPRAGHRRHAQAQPGPPPEVHRDPHVARGYPPGEPAGQSRLLPGRAAPAVQGHASSAAAGPAARSSSTPTSPIRSTSRQKRQARTVVTTRAEKVLEARTRTPSASGSTTSTAPSSRP